MVAEIGHEVFAVALDFVCLVDGKIGGPAGEFVGVDVLGELVFVSMASGVDAGFALVEVSWLLAGCKIEFCQNRLDVCIGFADEILVADQVTWAIWIGGLECEKLGEVLVPGVADMFDSTIEVVLDVGRDDVSWVAGDEDVAGVCALFEQNLVESGDAGGVEFEAGEGGVFDCSFVLGDQAGEEDSCLEAVGVLASVVDRVEHVCEVAGLDEGSVGAFDESAQGSV